MASESPSKRAEKIEQYTSSILRLLDLYEASSKHQQNIEQLKVSLNNSRKLATLYEFAETREEQLKNAKLAKKWLVKARSQILFASEYNIFEPIDVAQLSAEIDQLFSDLK